jgi:hypothetical protein
MKTNRRLALSIAPRQRQAHPVRALAVSVG